MSRRRWTSLLTIQKQAKKKVHAHMPTVSQCARPSSLLAQCRSRENRVPNRNVRETEAQPDSDSAAHSSCSDSFHCTAESSLPRFFSFHLTLICSPGPEAQKIVHRRSEDLCRGATPKDRDQRSRYQTVRLYSQRQGLKPIVEGPWLLRDQKCNILG